MPSADVAERFWSKVEKSDGCWEWTGSKGPKGYGMFNYGSSTAAHRVAWMLTHGPITDGRHICHHCDNPGCVRPDHLFLGTNADNVADKMRKGRQGQQSRRSGTGSLRLIAKNRWELRASSGVKNPVTGRVIQISRTVNGTKKDAERAMRKLQAEIEQGKLAHRDKTFQLLADGWFDQAQRKLSPTTIRAYRQNLKHHILPALGPIPLHKLSVADLDRLYMKLEDAGKAPRTIKQCHAIVSRALRQGQIWGWVHENPARLATLPRVPESELHPPTAKQVADLVIKAEELDPLLAVVIRLAADTGARRGELCGLRWPDFDPTTNTLTIARAIVPVPGGLTEKDTKTHQRRPVLLWQATAEALAHHRQDVLQSARLARVDLAPDAYVFSRGPDGSVPLNPDALSAAFRVVRVAAGLPFRFHDLRHFVGNELVARNVPLPAVSRRLGHRHVSTTSDIYARHSTVEADRQASQVIGQLLSPSQNATKPAPSLPGGKPEEDGAD